LKQPAGSALKEAGLSYPSEKRRGSKTEKEEVLLRGKLEDAARSSLLLWGAWVKRGISGIVLFLGYPAPEKRELEPFSKRGGKGQAKNPIGGEKGPGFAPTFK